MFLISIISLSNGLCQNSSNYVGIEVHIVKLIIQPMRMMKHRTHHEFNFECFVAL